MGVLTGILIVLGGAAAYFLWPTAAEPDDQVGSGQAAVAVAWGRPVVTEAGLAARSGVVITQVAVTGAGGLVDVRFEVVEPNRAATVHDPATPPAIIDEQTGLVVHDLFMDHSHTGAFKAGVTYYYVFTNPQNRVRRGSEVTVLLGGVAVQHVVVQ